MPLDARKLAHILSNRDKIRAGRTETIVFVSIPAGVITYTAIPNASWYDAGAVPAGISTRSGEITRFAHDAILELPITTTFPTTLKLIARTPTATQAAAAAADRFTVLDKRHLGPAPDGDRWHLRLRRVK